MSRVLYRSRATTALAAARAPAAKAPAAKAATISRAAPISTIALSTVALPTAKPLSISRPILTLKLSSVSTSKVVSPGFGRSLVTARRNMATITASPFRLALIQLGTTSTIKADNIALARAKVAEAAAAVPKPDLIVLPEIWNSPYAVTSFRQYSEPVPTVGSTGGGAGGINGHGNGDVNGNGDAEHQGRGEVEGETITALRQMARDAGCWLIGGSIPEREASTDSIFNCATAYDPQGKMVAKHRKVHLFDIDIPGRQKFKESDVLTGGNQITSFDAPFGKIGMGICYDIRFPELAMIAARQGCVAMIYPSAFNTTTGPMHWTLLQKARAVDNQMYVAMCSPARNPNASYQAWGHSMVVNPLGEVLVEADHEPAILYADIDPEMLATVRRNLPVTIQRRFDVYPDVAAGAKQ